MTTTFCDHGAIVEYGYVNPILYTLLAISMIPPICIFIYKYIKGDLKTSKLLFYLAVLLYAIIFADIVCWAINYRLVCSPDYYPNSKGFRFSLLTLYGVQGVMVVSILFVRLVLIFENSDLAVSMRTIRLFIVLVIMCVLLNVLGLFLYAFTDGFYPYIMFSFSGLICLYLVVHLNTLFVYKIYHVHKVCEKNGNVIEDDEKLLRIIVKTSTLSFISTSQMILFQIVVYIHWIVVYVSVLYNVVQIGDLYTNFLSIFLSYSYFDPLYTKLCGCCHDRCQRCWKRCFHDKNARMIAKDMQDNAPKPSDTEL
eukprot:23555_1